MAYCKACRKSIDAERRRVTPGADNAAVMRNRAQDDARKYNVRQKVGYAVRTGKLIRPGRCERCGAPCKPHAHHPDYSKPLEVEWLCTPCHESEHHDASH